MVCHTLGGIMEHKRAGGDVEDLPVAVFDNIIEWSKTHVVPRLDEEKIISGVGTTMASLIDGSEETSKMSAEVTQEALDAVRLLLRDGQ